MTNMKKLSQQMFAAIAAVLGFAGLASAQYVTPNYQYGGFSIPSIMPAKANPDQPVQSGPVQPVQQLQAAPIVQLPPTPTPPPSPSPSAAGCSSCGNGAARTPPVPYLPRGTAFGAGLAPVPYNEYCAQCANGCGSIKSDCGFIFGSCKSFLNPCRPIPCNGFGPACSKCRVFPYGKPYGNGFNTCVYDSYLNH